METAKQKHVDTDRKELGKQLRASHFTLGNDNYPKKEGNYINLNVENGLISRRSNLNLGEIPCAFQTSSMDQNKLIETNRNKYTFSSLDPAIITDLRNSHFSLGHAKATYVSASASQFYDKTNKGGESNGGIFKEIGKALRQQHYTLGDSKPDYKTETAVKFNAAQHQPEDRNLQKISTTELQKAHFQLGNNTQNYETTSTKNFGPKISTFERMANPRSSNFDFKGNQLPDQYLSSSSQQFVAHKVNYDPMTAEKVNKYKSSNLIFGTDNQNYNTQNSVDFERLAIQPKTLLSVRHPATIQIGKFDNLEERLNNYTTTYGVTMKPNDVKPFVRNSMQSNYSSIILDIAEKNPKLASESMASYNYNKPTDKSKAEDAQIKSVINKIRKVNYKLGESVNDYKTATQEDFIYNSNKASNSRVYLDQSRINDLKASHYNLGYDNVNLYTSSQISHRPLDNDLYKNPSKSMPRKTTIDLSATNLSLHEKMQTLYMQDYTKKAIVD